MVVMRAVFPTAEERDRVVKEYGAVEGGKQTLERLGEHLAASAGASPSGEFVISRVFDVPRELVWQAHNELDRLKHWWGPKGFTWLTGTLDFRPGGMFHYGMRSPKGEEMWGRFVYREIVKPERIVFINSFSDAKGGLTRAPFAGNWPLEVLNNLTLSPKKMAKRHSPCAADPSMPPRKSARCTPQCSARWSTASGAPSISSPLISPRPRKGGEPYSRDEAHARQPPIERSSSLAPSLRVPRVDRARIDGAMVGPEILHPPCLRNGRALGRRVAHHHALA